jgi:hypothetical protein
MVRSVPNDSWNKVGEDEQFDDPSIIAAITGYMSEHRSLVTATVSEEWERNEDEIMRGALGESEGKTWGTVDLVLSVEIRVPFHSRSHIEAIEGIETRAKEIIAYREQERLTAEIAVLEIQRAEALAAAAKLEEKLASLRG